jgi:RNA polymerase sigma-70 factor (ECF subfamily)
LFSEDRKNKRGCSLWVFLRIPGAELATYAVHASDSIAGARRQSLKRDPQSDLDLIAAINRGDAASFEILYRRYREWVVRLAYRFTGDEDLALDVLQETFLYFLQKFPGFVLTANLKTFLYPAVKNLSITARRKSVRYQSTPAEQDFLETLEAFQPDEGGGGKLAAALGHLSEEHRETLLLRFVDDLSLAEIAEAMEVPLGTVKSRLHTALSILRRDPRTKAFFENADI